MRGAQECLAVPLEAHTVTLTATMKNGMYHCGKCIVKHFLRKMEFTHTYDTWVMLSYGVLCQAAQKEPARSALSSLEQHIMGTIRPKSYTLHRIWEGQERGGLKKFIHP